MKNFRKICWMLPGLVLATVLLGPVRAADAPVAGAAKDKKPNILFILADDLGWSQTGYGNPFFITPHIDAIAAQGVRFTNAYAAAPVCSPSRGALMTGKAPARLHITDYIPGTDHPHARVLQPDWQKFLPLSEVTIAERLTERGYVTAMFGKWHLAKAYVPPRSVDEGPDRQGFAETLITQKPSKKADPERDAHGTEAISQRAMKFLDEHHNEPFFLELCYNSVHAPVMAPAAFVKKFQARPGSDRPENSAIIAGMMEVLDNGIGRVLAKLDELGLRENTLVIFYSDNGGLLHDASQAPLRGGKAQLYEGGIRVPLAMRWPGVITAGRTCATPVTTVDFFPTFLELCGGKPEAPAPQQDGVSLVSLIRGNDQLERDTLFWHYPHYHAAGVGPSGAVRAGDWKLIEYYEGAVAEGKPRVELFNLKNDFVEAHDLATTEPALAAKLRARLNTWLDSVGAQRVLPNPNYDPVKDKAETKDNDL